MEIANTFSNKVFSNFVGIDVSKDTLDVFSTETSKHCKISNGNKAIKTLFVDFNPNNTFVVLENTGGYEKYCIRSLLSMGFTIHRTNNNMVKALVESLDKKGKTDKVDARYLSMYGEERHRKLKVYELPGENQETIRQLAKYIYELKVTRAEGKNRLQSPGCENIASEILKTNELLDTRIEEIEERINELLKADKETRKTIELICKYNGIGKSTAIQLIAHLPELGTVNRRAISALAGCAPYANDSGKSKGYRTTKGGGRPIVKRVLFMAALSATRFNDSISDHYQKKQSEGKKKMVAMVACMRKMIVQLNAIVRDGEIKPPVGQIKLFDKKG
jgi:transposase